MRELKDVVAGECSSSQANDVASSWLAAASVDVVRSGVCVCVYMRVCVTFVAAAQALQRAREDVEKVALQSFFLAAISNFKHFVLLFLCHFIRNPFFSFHSQ